MDRRVQLGQILHQILGTNHVYFQPPNNVQMVYPAIRYELEDISTVHADNQPYLLPKRYQITFITRDPDDPVIDKIASLPKCQFDRPYVSDQLHHYIYSIYF